MYNLQMKRLLHFAKYFVIIFVSLFVGFLLSETETTQKVLPAATEILKDTKLKKYSMESLIDAEVPFGKFEILDTLEENDDFTSYLFSFEFAPGLDPDETKITTGILNLPTTDGDKNFPLVIMIRGFVDQEIYASGMGTSRAAEVFVEAGYMTISPDFLGYAGSSEESGNIFETRFQTYTTVMALLKSIKSGSFADITDRSWDRDNTFIWAHSNGGQVALTVLAATGDDIPTTLWAPVTKPFPYSILYYTDSSIDGGKFLRRELSDFEKDYDVDRFSFTNYLGGIEAPIKINQGTADDAIPTDWTDEFVGLLESFDKEVVYRKFPGADHNLRPNWVSAVESDLGFFEEHLLY